jgi:hypothetical protein
MIKSYTQFIREFVEGSDSVLDAKMQEIKELIDSIGGQTFMYEWENKNDHELFINFTNNELILRYEFDIDDLILTKIASNVVDFKTKVRSIDEGLDIIEKDIHSILGISEKVKEKTYKGRKIPKKYLTHKPKAMKKEIETFRGKKEYKKDWEADYDKRSGKRIKTKKSASTIAYQKKFEK